MEDSRCDDMDIIILQKPDSHFYHTFVGFLPGALDVSL